MEEGGPVVRAGSVIGAIGLALTLWACEQAEPPSAPMTRQSAGTIVAMGDSLTEGLGVAEHQAYPVLLERSLKEKGFDYRVVNAGVSGETSSGARARLNWVLSLAPDIVILETGANDGLRGVDPELIRTNIEAIVKEFRSRGITVVLAGMQMVTNLGRQYTRAFSSVYTDLAREHDIIFVPFFLEGVGGKPLLNQPDGIHPNAAGYEVIVKNLLPHVIEAIGHHQGRSG
jgi:acyl-CoA thioesterase-1